MSTNLDAPHHYLSRRAFMGLAGSAALGIASFSLFGCSFGDGASFDDSYLGLEVFESAEAKLDRKVNGLLESMSDHEKLCQLFLVTPETLVGGGDTVTQADEALRQALEATPAAGIVFFERNLVDEAQTKTMLKNALDYGVAVNGIPPFLGVDEEGGTIVRIAGNQGFSVDNVGDMAEIGATEDANQAKEAAEYIGGYLKELGFNTDFAPVCDVANNPESDTMRKRSFSDDADLVGKMVSAQIKGFEAADMLCTAKHFPGIGAAVGDSHNERIVYNGTLDQLEATELVPFKAAIRAGVPLVMVGHLSLPQIVGDETPASLSYEIVTGLLRNKLHFEGVILPDSLLMNAVSGYYSACEACIKALQAGCDLLLMPADLQSCLDSISTALEEGVLTWDRIDDALRRTLRLKLTLQ